jgi:hypothetical protein
LLQSFQNAKEEIMPRMLLSIPVLAAIVGFGISPSRAQTYGEAPWCAVLQETDGEVIWQCYYRSVEDCRVNVIAGNRGSCNLNPYGPGPSAPQTAAPSTHRKRHAQRS